MPAPYSAGSIFVSVIPVFNNVQNRIRDEFNDAGQRAGRDFGEKFGDEAGKGMSDAVRKGGQQAARQAKTQGDKAGKEYAGNFVTSMRSALASAQRELKAIIKVEVDDDNLKALQARLQAMDTKLDGEFDASEMLAEIDRVEAKLRGIHDAAGDNRLRMDIAPAVTALESFRQRAKQAIEANLVVDDVKAERQLGAFERQFRDRIAAALTGLPPIELDADSDDVDREIERIRAELLSLQDRNIELDVDAKEAIRETSALEYALDRVIAKASQRQRLRYDASRARDQLKAVAAAAEQDAAKPREPEPPASRGDYGSRFKAAAANATSQVSAVVTRLELDDRDAARTLAEVRADLELLDTDFDLGMDAGDVEAELTRIESRLRRIKDAAGDVESRNNLDRAIGSIAGFREQSQANSSRDIQPDEAPARNRGAFESTLRNRTQAAVAGLPTYTFDVDADITPAQLEVAKLRGELIALGEADVEVDGGSGALAQARAMYEALSSRIDGDNIEPELRFNLTGAAAQLKAFIDSVDPEIPVEINPGEFRSKLIAEFKAAEQVLPKITLDADTTGVQRDLATIAAQIKATAADLEIGGDIGDALSDVIALQGYLQSIRDTSIDVEVNGNVDSLLGRLKAIRESIEVKVEPELGYFRTQLVAAVESAQAALPDLKLGADATDVDRELAAIKARMAALVDDIKIGVDVEDARAELLGLQAALARLRDKNVNVEVKTDILRALVQLEAFDKKVERSRRQSFDAANSFRAFSGILLGLATVGPLAAVGIGVAAGAIAGLIPLAAVGVGALGVFAFSLFGVADAVKAMADVQTNATKDAKAYADGVRNASRSLRAAEQGVADARRSAADARVNGAERVASAIERVDDAEDALTRAQKDQTRAQKTLTEAREAASERLIDLQMQIRGGALAERRAYMQLAEAEAAYANALADPGATRTEREQLLLDLDEQKFALDGVLLSNQRLAEQSSETAQAGVEGAEEVTRAQEGVEDANERVAEAQESLAKAQADVAKARADAARAEQDAQRQIEDAQLRLIDAQADYADALSKTSASQDALAESLAKLSPAGREFAAYLFSLKPIFEQLQGVAAAGVLPGLQEWMQDIIGSRGPQLISIVGGMSTAIGDAFRYWGDLLKGEEWGQFFAILDANAPQWIADMAQVSGNIGTGFANLFVAFAGLTDDMSGGLVGLSEDFRLWTQELPENQGFQNFLAFVERVGPKVMEFFSALAGALQNIGVAIAPYAELLLDLFTGMLNWIATIDPANLQTFLVVLLGLIIAFQTIVGLSALAAGAVQLINLAMLPVVGPIILIIGAIVLLGIALAALWLRSETFRDIVTAAWDAIVDAVMVAVNWFEQYVWPVMQEVFEAIGDIAMWLWEEMLQPAFEGISRIWAEVMDVLEHAWNKVGKPIFEMFASIAQSVWSVVGPIFQLIGLAFGALGDLIGWYWQNVVAPVWNAFIDVAVWLWENVLGPIFRFIIDGFGVLAGAIKSTWDNVLKPVFDFFGAVLSALVDTFTGTKADIEAIWNSLLDILMSPIVFVVDTVLNKGLIAGINWIAQLFTDDEHWIPDIPTDWIPGRATGGPIPGSSPHKRADNVLIRATAGEYMQQVDAVDYWGMDFMDMVNSNDLQGVMSLLPGRAYGGPIDEALGNYVKRQFPSARVTSAYRPGDPGFHGKKMAVDFAGAKPWPDPAGMDEMLRINQWLARTVGTGLRELIHTAPGAINLYKGQPHTYNAKTRGEHMNHVHAAIESAAALTGGSGFAKLVDYDDSIFGKIADFVESPVQFLKDIATSFAGDKMSGKFGQMLMNVPFDIAESFGQELLELTGLSSGSFGASKEIFPDGASGDVRSVVRQVAGQFGWGDGASWNALNWIINKESGWNPNAQNPSSTASGLFQHINSTWNAYKPPGVTAGRMRDADIPDQATAGMRYIMSRYGTPGKAKDFWERNNYYADGGEIRPFLFDDGGWLMPGMPAISQTRDPEPVFSPGQWELIRDRVEVGDEHTGPFRDLIIEQVQSDPYETAGTVVHEVKVQQARGGRYRGTGSGRG